VDANSGPAPSDCENKRRARRRWYVLAGDLQQAAFDIEQSSDHLMFSFNCTPPDFEHTSLTLWFAICQSVKQHKVRQNATTSWTMPEEFRTNEERRNRLDAAARAVDNEMHTRLDNCDIVD
jgi:hypothetical protein